MNVTLSNYFDIIPFLTDRQRQMQGLISPRKTKRKQRIESKVAHADTTVAIPLDITYAVIVFMCGVLAHTAVKIGDDH